jgi:hypothetical protein
MHTTHTHQAFWFLFFNKNASKSQNGEISISEEGNRTKREFFLTLYDSYADLYFQNKKQGKRFDKDFSVCFRCEKLPREPNIVIWGLAL